MKAKDREVILKILKHIHHAMNYSSKYDCIDKYGGHKSDHH